MLTIDLIEEVPSPVAAGEFVRAFEPISKNSDLGTAAVEVLITTDERMQALNRRRRGVNATTDVLSLPTAFDTTRGAVVPDPSRSLPRPGGAPDDKPLLHLGTIVICLPEVRRKVAQGESIADDPVYSAKPKGRRGGETIEAEVLGLAVHGLRHLLGHDHNETGEWLPPTHSSVL